jgi:hypothetical protein
MNRPLLPVEAACSFPERQDRFLIIDKHRIEEFGRS